MLEYVLLKLPISWQCVQYCAVPENNHEFFPQKRSKSPGGGRRRPCKTKKFNMKHKFTEGSIPCRYGMDIFL